MARNPTKQPRLEDSRSRILSAARRRFAADGYERTTIRAVAADARIDPSMVMRYFGSKDGLFAAAASFDLKLPDLASMAHAERGNQLALHFLELWGRDAAGGGLATLLRTAATHDAAAARVREVFCKQVLPAISSVVVDKPSARAAMIASQILGMAYCRYVLKLPALQRLGERALAANLGQTIQRYLEDDVVDS